MNDDDVVCRICRGGGTELNPLYHPCKCTGSIRFVHQNCLKTWLDHSNSTKCELCGQEFVFEDVFSPTMPKRLPLVDVIRAVSLSVTKKLKSIGRLLLVVLCYGVIVPIAVRWSWKFYFEDLSIVTDSDASIAFALARYWLEGGTACALLIALFIGLISVREFVFINGLGHRVGDPMVILNEQLLEQQQPPPPDSESETESEGYNSEEELEIEQFIQPLPRNYGIRLVAGQDPVLQVMEPSNGAESREEQDDGDDGDDDDDDDDYDYSYSDEEDGYLEDDEEDIDYHVNQTIDDSASQHHRPTLRRRRNQNNEEAMEQAEANRRLLEQVDWNRFANNIAQEIERAEREQRLAEDDDQNDNENPIRPQIRLTEDQIRQLGQQIQAEGARRAQQNHAINAVNPPNEQGLGNQMNLADDDDDDNIGVAAEPVEAAGLLDLLGFEGPISRPCENVAWILIIVGFLMTVFAFLPHHIGKLSLVFVPIFGSHRGFFASTAVGYFLSTIVIGAYLHFRGELTNRSSKTRHVVGFLLHFLKVVLFFTFEFTVVPVEIGWWIDICTLEVQGTTLPQRLAFHNKAPWTSYVLHGLVGLIYMQNFATVLSMLKSKLRKGMLWMFRDPDDPEFQPLKYILETSAIKHVFAIIGIATLLNLTAALCIYLPSKILSWVLPSTLPLRFYLTHPAELLGYNLLLPFILEAGGTPSVFEVFVLGSIGKLASFVGLRHFVIPPTGDTDTTTETSHRPSYLILRMTALMIILTFALVAFCTFLVVVPIFLGRTLIHQVFGIQLHDIFTFVLGAGATWVLLSIIMSIYHSASFIWEACRSVSRQVKLLGQATHLLIHMMIYGFALPLIVGILADLALFSLMRTNFDSTVTMFSWYNWVGGCFVLKIAHHAVLSGDETDYRRNLETIAENGWANLNLPLIRRVSNPVLFICTLLLSSLIFVTHRILPLLHFSERSVSLVFRLTLPTSALILGLFLTAYKLHKNVSQVSNEVLREKYLIHRRLLNHEEGLVEPDN